MIETGNKQLVQDQVTMVRNKRRDRRSSKMFPMLYLLYAALRCHKGHFPFIYRVRFHYRENQVSVL